MGKRSRPAAAERKSLITTTLDEREEEILITTARAGGRDNSSAALAQAKIDAAIAAFPEIDFTSEHGRAQRATLEKLGMGGQGQSCHRRRRLRQEHPAQATCPGLGR